MEKEVARIRTHVGRSKFAIFAIAGFLGLMTYLMISLSNQIASLSTQSSLQAAPIVNDEPITLEEPRACGEACAYSSASENWEKPCGDGLSCQKARAVSVEGGIVGWCRPTQGGSCPLLMGTRGHSCSDENGNETHQCVDGTTCKSAGFLGYKVCAPDTDNARESI